MKVKTYTGPERRKDPLKPYVVMWTPYPGAVLTKNSCVDFWTEQQRNVWISKMLKRYPKAEFILGLRNAA